MGSEGYMIRNTWYSCYHFGLTLVCIEIPFPTGTDAKDPVSPPPAL